jgi:thymidylate kinase
MTKNYRLPVEPAYIHSASQGEVFKIPAPEFEYVVFVIRMILKHATWDVILGREGSLSKAERREMEYLQDAIDSRRVADILTAHLPWLDARLFKDCVAALRPGCPAWTRVNTGRRLLAHLQAFARRSSLVDTFLKFWRRGVLMLRRRIARSSEKHQFEAGGAVIAFVGGDGAGKSTAIDGLHAWLSKEFDLTKVHLGKPAWSLTTRLVRSVLKIGQLLGLYPLEAPFQATLEQKSLVSPGYPFIIREVCRARDRFNTYFKARRYAANGGLVIFDRFPLPQIELMDGPQVGRFVRQLQAGPYAKRFLSPHPDHRFVKFLVRLEESYYRKFISPELLFVLRLDPEVAVQRKPEETAASVRARSTAIMAVDWENTSAHIIDASKPKQAVMTELKTLIWAEL